jgi:hypothetical protein
VNAVGSVDSEGRSSDVQAGLHRPLLSGGRGQCLCMRRQHSGSDANSQGRECQTNATRKMGRHGVDRICRPSGLAHLPGSFKIEPTLNGTWVMVSNGEVEDDDEQKITASGWLFSAGVLVEASAFGCDSKVVERAVNQALQKAADAELDSWRSQE